MISLPRLDYAGPATRTIEAGCLFGAATLLIVNVIRLTGTRALLRWWVPLVAIAAALVADLTSRLVHWTADTWGRESMPVIGRRFLCPFRVHHINPDDFLVNPRRQRAPLGRSHPRDGAAYLGCRRHAHVVGAVSIARCRTCSRSRTRSPRRSRRRCEPRPIAR
jgi:hypothetical protein